MRILAISGSLRAGSHNTALLREAAELAPEGVEVRFLEGLADVPPYDQDKDHDHPPEAVVRLRGQIDEADALLFATPEYNHSIPGQLKNAIDWASRPHGVCALFGRPAAVVGASTGAFGAVWAQAELRKVLGAAGARVVEGELAVGQAHKAFEEDGRLRGESARERLGALLERLVAEVPVSGAAA